MNKKLLLINGSVRKKGTSYSFANSLMALSNQLGHSAEILQVMDYFEGKENFEALSKKVTEADVIGIIAPIYVDTLPYPDIWFLEQLERLMKLQLKDKGLFSIGQCGFPDDTRCEPIGDMCKLFALDMEMHWLGGLNYGGGPLINGASLETLGKRGEKITKGFKMALEEMLKGNEIPDSVQKMISLNMPKFLFAPMAAFMNHNAKKTAILKGITDIAQRPYM